MYIDSNTACNMRMGWDDLEASWLIGVIILYNSYVPRMDALTYSEDCWFLFLIIDMRYRPTIREKSEGILQGTDICPLLCMRTTLYHERLSSWMDPLMIGHQGLS
jgi:hypothetical protein